MKKLLILFLFTTSIAYSQDYIETTFEKSFELNANQKINSILKTSDNDYILIGHSEFESKGGEDIWVSKISETGEVRWEYTYGERLKDEGLKAIETKNGFIVVGYTNSPLSGYTQGILIHINKKGKLKRKVPFAMSSYTKINDIAVSKSGNIFITGVIKDSGNDDINIFVSKLNSSYAKLWIQNLGVKYYTDEPFSIKLNKKDEIFVSGYSMNSKDNSNVYCVKLDSYGEPIVEKTIETKGNEKVFDMCLEQDGSVILVGESTEASKGETDMLFIKLDENLNVKKKNTFGNYKRDVLRSVVSINNSYVAVGYTESLKNKRTMYMIKFDVNGDIVWERANTKYPHSEARNIILTSDQTYIVVGASENKENGKTNALLVQYKSNENAVIDNYISEKTKATASDQVKDQTRQEAIKFYSTKEGITLAQDDALAENTDGFSEFRGSGDPLKGLNVGSDINNIKIGKYYALIIGIDNYSGKWSKLKNAVNDAKAIENVLKTNYKFTSFKTLYNDQATRNNIISSFETLMKIVKPEDNVFIYYSGHGDYKKDLNKGYWVPIDAQTLSVTNYVSNSDLQTFLTGIQSKHTLLVADACFSGDIFRGKTMNIPFENSERYYKQVYSLKSRQAMTSGGIEPVMDGGKDGHSVFAYYLLKALRANKLPMMDAGQVFEKLKIPVFNNSDQSPDFKAVSKTGDEGGQFIFMKKNK